MYFLMNKNTPIGRFDIDEAEHRICRPFEAIGDRPLPIGFQNITGWAENRRASKHNAHLRKRYGGGLYSGNQK